MIVCNNCGSHNSEGTPFCEKCGHYLPFGSTAVVGPPGSAVRATLKSQDLTVEPGSQITSEIEVFNEGRLVDDYRLQITGLDDSWCSVEPTSLRLMPKSSASARALFRPPRAPNPTAGTVPFVVTANSTVDPAVKASVAGSITIAPFAEVVASLVPQTSESVRAAEHSVRVENRGNGPNRVTLSVQDADDKIASRVTPSEMALDPGSSGNSRVVIWPRNQMEPRGGRRLPFQVLVQPVPGAPVRLDGATVLLEPQPGWWAKWRLAIGAVLALAFITAEVAWAGPPYPHWPPFPQSSSLPQPSASPAPSPPPSASPVQPPAVGKLSVNPSHLTFGNVPMGGGSSATITVTVTNSGNGKTHVTTQLSDSSNFTIHDLCAGSELGPNQQCELQILFRPRAEGPFDAKVTFVVVNANTPDPVLLSGTGQGHLTPLLGPITGINGLCVDDLGSVTNNGNPVIVFQCTGNPNQNWTVGVDDTLSVLGKCMNIKDGSSADFTLIELSDCNGSASQVWQWRPNGELVNPYSGKCLDDNGSGGPLTQLILFTCTGTSNQLWALP